MAEVCVEACLAIQHCLRGVFGPSGSLCSVLNKSCPSSLLLGHLLSKMGFHVTWAGVASLGSLLALNS